MIVWVKEFSERERLCGPDFCSEVDVQKISSKGKGALWAVLDLDKTYDNIDRKVLQLFGLGRNYWQGEKFLYEK